MDNEIYLFNFLKKNNIFLTCRDCGFQTEIPGEIIKHKEFCTKQRESLVEKIKNEIYREIIINNLEIKLDRKKTITERVSIQPNIEESESSSDPQSEDDIKKSDETSDEKEEETSDEKEEETSDEKEEETSDEKEEETSDEKVKKPKKTITKRVYFRTIKDKIKLSDEKDWNKIVREIDKTTIKQDDLFSISKEEIFNKIRILVKSLEKSRVFRKILIEIQTLRIKLLIYLNITEYTTFLQNHFNKVKEIFKTKGNSEQKSKQILKKSFNSLEIKFLEVDTLGETNLEMNDIIFLKNCLNIRFNHPKKFKIFSKNEFIKSMLDYSSSLFSLKENVSRNLVNKYGLNSVIYLPINNSDPFSFYCLEKYDKKIRCWRMDCRLEETVSDFISNVLPYCIEQYRLFFKIVFNDNDYRENMNSFGNTIIDYNCSQLIQTIFILSHKELIYKLFYDILIKTKFYPTSNDKFNLFSDDVLQKKDLKKILILIEMKLLIP